MYDFDDFAQSEHTVTTCQKNKTWSNQDDSLIITSWFLSPEMGSLSQIKWDLIIICMLSCLSFFNQYCIYATYNMSSANSDNFVPPS